MMVCDKNCHSKTFSVRDLAYRCNSIITGNDRINSRLICLLNQMIVDSVTIFHPVRYLKIHTATAACDSFVQNISRHYPINIVVAYDPDLFLFTDLLHQYIRQPVRIQK